MNDLKRLRGALTLLTDAVDQGAAAIQKVHLATAERPFTVLEAIAPTAPVARIVHAAHDTIASGVYATIRATSRLVGAAATAAVDAAEKAAGAPGAGTEELRPKATEQPLGPAPAPVLEAAPVDVASTSARLP
jgi:hypothetical protein